MSTQIQISINGEDRIVTSSNILELVTELGLSSKKIAVELNKNIISKELYNVTDLSDGDKLEIVHFIGGG